MTCQRVALLVDGDNITPAQGPFLLAEAHKLGRLDVARVYSAAPGPNRWRNTPGFLPVDTGGGKNATDIVLSIEAMELALAQGLDSFVLASSDSDFSHVALRLRATGRHVLGIGETKTPETFRAACSAFLPLTEAKPAALPPPSAPKMEPVDKKIREIFQAAGNKRDMSLSLLGAKLGPLNLVPKRTLRGHLQQRTELYKVDPKGPDAMVRLVT